MPLAAYRLASSCLPSIWAAVALSGWLGMRASAIASSTGSKALRFIAGVMIAKARTIGELQRDMGEGDLRKLKRGSSDPAKVKLKVAGQENGMPQPLNACYLLPGMRTSRSGRRCAYYARYYGLRRR